VKMLFTGGRSAASPGSSQAASPISPSVSPLRLTLQSDLRKSEADPAASSALVSSLAPSSQESMPLKMVVGSVTVDSFLRSRAKVSRGAGQPRMIPVGEARESKTAELSFGECISTSNSGSNGNAAFNIKGLLSEAFTSEGSFGAYTNESFSSASDAISACGEPGFHSQHLIRGCTDLNAMIPGVGLLSGGGSATYLSSHKHGDGRIRFKR
jgi:hypothetical protein